MAFRNANTQMKTKKVQKLLSKMAKKNDIEIDEITGGKKDIDLWGEDVRGFDVLISVGRGKSGDVTEVSYMNFGADINSTFDNLYISVEVDNAKNFIKDVGGTFNTFVIIPGRADIVSSFIDTFRGVSPGDYSTYVSIGGGLDYSFS